MGKPHVSRWGGRGGRRGGGRPTRSAGGRAGRATGGPRSGCGRLSPHPRGCGASPDPAGPPPRRRRRPAGRRAASCPWMGGPLPGWGSRPVGVGGRPRFRPRRREQGCEQVRRPQRTNGDRMQRGANGTPPNGPPQQDCPAARTRRILFLITTVGRGGALPSPAASEQPRRAGCACVRGERACVHLCTCVCVRACVRFFSACRACARMFVHAFFAEKLPAAVAKRRCFELDATLACWQFRRGGPGQRVGDWRLD